MTAPRRTHYDILGIAPDADAVAVRTAWKLHVQVWHPDRFTGDMRAEAERQAARINEAYTTLRDSSRRAAYDCRLAAEDAGSRAEAPRWTTKTRPSVPRPAATPVGTPMAIAEPLTPLQQLAATCGDALDILRRHPRITASVAACWLLVFGGGAVLHVTAGPSLPSGSAQAASSTVGSGPAARISPEDETDLEDLAERARREASVAEAELAALLRDDAAAQAAADAADARAAAAAARDPRAGAQLAPRPPGGAAARGGGAAATAPTPGRRIVRVMPDAR